MSAEIRPTAADLACQINWRRLRRPAAGVALLGSAIASLSQTFGTVIAGQLAQNPSTRLVVTLGLFVIGAALVDTAARFIWSSVVDRAAGTLRQDLLTVALHQPLAALSEQAVGEILDRVDDDTHNVGTLVRLQVWQMLRTLFSVLPMWLVAGFTWWPAFFLFPVMAAVTGLLIRPLLAPIASRKVTEEIAWTDHAAALEEGIAGRDDLRTSLGQAYVVRRMAGLSALVHDTFAQVIRLETQLIRRSGVLLHALLAGIAVAGVALVLAGDLGVGALVTLFLVTTTFVGQVGNMAEQLPELQAGVGAVARLRQMFAAPQEPDGGRKVPEGHLSVELRDLHFAYQEGTFALDGVTLTVAAGSTVALVGRTGSGKSTLAALLSRAVEPEPGSVFLGGVDVGDLDLQELRAAVGVVSQRTDILAGTLAENITLFADLPRAHVAAAIVELGLTDWVAGLPQGLDTPLGAGGTTLSAGEEQLVAFARLLVRDVRVVILDEATARMDPLTERRVVASADRLLNGRTGILIAHRLSTTERAHRVAVLDHGRVVQQGARAELSRVEGPFRRLLESSSSLVPAQGGVGALPPSEPAESSSHQLGHQRRTGPPPEREDVGTGPSLARGIRSALLVRPAWGIAGAIGFLIAMLLGAYGVVPGFVWGQLVAALKSGGEITWFLVVLVASLLIAPLAFADAVWRYLRWWVEILLRVRMAVLRGQTQQRRLARTPAGEVVARSMDADRYARYADRWVDFINGLIIAGATAAFAGSLLAAGVLLAVMAGSALASILGRPAAGKSATTASQTRAEFGRSLVSALESARTIKLAGATSAVHEHLQRVDSGRVQAAVREHRVQAVLHGVPIVMVQVGVVAAWAAVLWGWWGLATALLVANTVNGFDWFGRVSGSIITEAPGTRSWQQATSSFASGVDLMHLPTGIDLLSGAAPSAPVPTREGLRELELRDVTALHDDGTIGVADVNLRVRAGELVLLVGQVGSGKSSLLASLAGLISHHGQIWWNGTPVEDAETFLRPGQVAHVAQVPRVLSGTFADNIRLDHAREIDRPVADARLAEDVESAGGIESLVGHRGVRLSGGQVQRLALARALAADTDLVLADDVSSALDAATELELWAALRQRRTTVIGATSKRAALALADRVVVLDGGAVAAVGPWHELEANYRHLAG